MMASEKMIYDPSLKLKLLYYLHGYLMAIWVLSSLLAFMATLMSAVTSSQFVITISQLVSDKQDQFGKPDSLNGCMF